MSPFTQPAWLEPRTTYVHVPFCGHHCGYCDFAVSAGQDHLIELYLDALEIELAGLSTPRPVESLFIGGGTPTYLNPDQLQRLLTAINRWLPRMEASPWEGGAPAEPISYGSAGAPPSRSVPEFSIESTPESLDDEKAGVLAAFGVNRVSVGVQSFQPHLLRSLDRRHGVEHIPRAAEAVRRHVPQLSFDLIFAAPGATLADWAADLAAALAFAPDHLSTYGLTYETGTPLWKQRSQGEVASLPEDDELAMYEHAIETLTAAGFEHYEVSNFARPGKRCRHNERYWANEAYHGFGVGAARYVDGRRELNVRDTKLYVQRVLAGESPTFQSERLEPRERAFETIAVQLRRADGIDRGRFREQTGYALDELVGEPVRELAGIGLLVDDGNLVRLTRRGFCVADGVVAKLLRLNRPG